MFQVLALLIASAPVGAVELSPAEIDAQILEAAAHALEASDNVPWTTAVIGGAVEPTALSILLDDDPSIYDGSGCTSGALPRICDAEGGELRCSRSALAALIELDSGRGHPSVPLLHAMAHDIGHLALGAEALSADELKLPLKGKTSAQRVGAIQDLLDRQVETATAEAQADTFADLVLSRRLKKSPYNVSDISAHLAVMEAARAALLERAECVLDDAPETTASERDLQRSARQLLCAAGTNGDVLLAAFEGSHADWPGRMRSLPRTSGKAAADVDTPAYYEAVSETLARQFKAPGAWPPRCDLVAVETFLDGFDDVPMVCPRMVTGLEGGEWTPITRIPITTMGNQLSIRGSSVQAPVLPSGRVGLILPEKQQVGTWAPGEPIAKLTHLPCTPTAMSEVDGGVLVACAEPAGIVEVADGKIRTHFVAELTYGGEPLDGAAARLSWVGDVGGRTWVTGATSTNVGFGWDVTGWDMVGQLAAWKGEGCDMLSGTGETEMWRADPEGEVQGMSADGMGFVFRVAPDGTLAGRASPRAWEEFAYEMDLFYGDVLDCGPSYSQKRTVCVDSQGSVFDPVPDPVDFDMELDLGGRSLRGDKPAAAVCDSSKARYALFHDANSADKEAWVLRSDADGTEELMIRPNITEARLTCGAAGAVVILGNAELSRISWLQ